MVDYNSRSSGADLDTLVLPHGAGKCSAGVPAWISPRGL